MENIKNILNYVEKLLQSLNKSLEDIKYVSYYDVKSPKSLRPGAVNDNYYYCSIREFRQLVLDNINREDAELLLLGWIHDIKFVGDNWWIQYDYHGDWLFFSLPIKPSKYNPDLKVENLFYKVKDIEEDGI